MKDSSKKSLGFHSTGLKNVRVKTIFYTDYIKNITRLGENFVSHPIFLPFLDIFFQRPKSNGDIGSGAAVKHAHLLQ